MMPLKDAAQAAPAGYGPGCLASCSGSLQSSGCRECATWFSTFWGSSIASEDRSSFYQKLASCPSQPATWSHRQILQAQAAWPLDLGCR